MGNDIDFGVGIRIGDIFGNRGDHGHRHQQQRDPLRDEAWAIARELDQGHTRRAADRLSDNLVNMPFPAQVRLVDEVNRFDRKGVGADLQLGNIDRRRGIWDDIRIIPPRYADYDRFPNPGGYPPGTYPPGGYPPGRFPPGGRYPNGNPEVDIRINIDLFKHNRGRR